MQLFAESSCGLPQLPRGQLIDTCERFIHQHEIGFNRQSSRKPDALGFLASDFSFEPYALVVRRDDPDFRLAVNRALVGVYKSGEIDAIFQRWFASLGRPGPLLNAMFYLQQLPE